MATGAATTVLLSQVVREAKRALAARRPGVAPAAGAGRPGGAPRIGGGRRSGSASSDCGESDPCVAPAPTVRPAGVSIMELEERLSRAGGEFVDDGPAFL